MTDDSIYIQHLGCHLHVGSFVLSPSNNHEEYKAQQVIGRIIWIKRTASEQEKECTVDVLLYVLVPDKSENLTTPLLRHITIITEHTSKMTINTKDIEDIAFVFHVDSPLLSQVSIHGMGNVFVTRDFHIPNFLLRNEISSQNFPILTSNYSQRIWNSLVLIQHTLRRLLSKYGMRQKLRQTEKIHVSEELWNFVLRKTSQGNTIRKCQTNRIIQVLTNGCRCHSVREKKSSLLIRFETHVQLSRLCSLLGETVIMGIRKPRPRVNQPREIGENEVINIVTGSSFSDGPTFKKSTKRTGIDFEYDGMYLQIVARYDRYLLSVNRETGHALNCPSDHLQRVLKRVGSNAFGAGDDVQSESSQSSLVGLLFRQTSRLFKIVSVPSDELLPIEALCMRAPFHERLDVGKVFPFHSRTLVETEVDNYLK
jgi:hypothetical protein